MNFSFLLAALAGSFFAADSKDDKTPQKDVEQLQGTWTVIEAIDEGRPDPTRKGEKYVFDGNNFVAKGLVGKVSFKLNSSKTPSEIDFLSGSEKKSPEKKDELKDKKDMKKKEARDLATPNLPGGIYKLSGDKLQMAFPLLITDVTFDPKTKNSIYTLKYGKRPTSFAGDKATILTLKRGEVEMKFNDDKYKKLIIGKWEASRSSPPFFSKVEFRDDGTVNYRDSNKKWKSWGRYVIEKEVIKVTYTYVNSSKSKNEKDEKVTTEIKAPIQKLTDGELETSYFEGKRMKE